MEEDTSQENIETTREKGDALEKSVEFIFQSAGFETKRGIKLAKYEIDVLAKIGNRTVIIECKNYQNSNIIVRNLIHQWNSKNQIIKAVKVIIVLAGININKSDKELADKLDIELWSDSDLMELFNLTLKPAQLKERLVTKISFKPITISELYRDEIAGIVIKPILSNSSEDIEETFQLFNNWLRVFIRTDLKVNETNKEERIKHIELFEETKEKNAFFNLLKVKRKETEYWNRLGERLRKEKILDGKLQDKYYKIMCELIGEYKNQKEYYNEEDTEKKIRKLIKDRLYNALISEDSLCQFGFQSSNVVEVIPADEGRFIIRIDGINDKQANLINWILTAEYFFTSKKSGNIFKEVYSWPCFSLDETAEKTYRILEEFFGYDKSDELRDYAL